MRIFIKTTVLIATVFTVIVSSCSGSSQLAEKLQGTWTGNPDSFTDNSAVTATIIETFYFIGDESEPNEKTDGGSVIITGMLSLSTQILTDDGELAEPLNLTAVAKSTINGTWLAINSSEVSLNLNPESLSVEVDPKTVELEGYVMFGATPRIDSISPTVAKNIATSIKKALLIRYASYRYINDIKFKNPILKFEIDGNDYTLTRNGN